MSAKRNPNQQVFTACILKHAQKSLSVMNIGKDKPSVAAATPTARSTPQTAQPASHIQKPQATTLTFSCSDRSTNALAKPRQVVKPTAATTRTLAKITGTVLATQQVTKPTPADSNFPATSTLQEYILNKNQSPAVTKKVKVKRRLTSSTDTLKKGESPTVTVLIRINVRKTLQKLLQSRIQACPDLTVAEEEVQKIAQNIEEELHDFFKDTGIKYKSKYRSLAFNIKDPKNLTLFRKIADKSVTPHQLVRLSSEELASQELAQWREREAKHQLEIIKRNELDLMTLSKTYVMKTHKGIQVIETEESLKTVVPELIDPASEPDIVSAINNSFSSNLEGTSSMPEKGKNNDKGKVRDKQKDDKKRCSEDQDRSSKQDGKRRHGHEWEHSKNKEEPRQGREKESESIHSREKGIQLIETVESLQTVVPELIDPASEPNIFSAINNSFPSTLKGTSSKPEKGKSNDKGNVGDKQKDYKNRCSEDQDRSSKWDAKSRCGHEWKHSKDKEETRWGREKESESVYSRERGICNGWSKYHHYSSEREKDKRSRKDIHDENSKKKIKMMTEKEEEIRLKQRVLNDVTSEINYLKNTLNCKNEELSELKYQLENLMKKLEDSTNQLVATDQKYQKQLSKTIEYSKMLVKMEDKLAKRQKVIELYRCEISKLKETILNLKMGHSREAPPAPPSGEGDPPLNMKADVPPQQQAVTFDFWHRFPQLFHGYDIPEGATASQPVVARECTKKEICSLNCDSPTLGMLATNHSDDMTFYIGQSLVRKFGKSKSPPSQRTKPFTCETCGKRFTLRGSLKTHEKLHAFRETFHCHICGKSFKVEGGLRSHAVLHTNHRPFMCMVCGKGFTLKGSLKTHLALHSVHRATFPCDICGKTYKGRASFDSHKAQHLGQPLYQCEVCGKNFTLKGSLKLHAMLHSGLKPYTCQACGMGFAIRSHLTRHFRMHMLR